MEDRGTASAGPLVTVILFAEEGSPFLAEAIESIVHQSYSHWELLLVSDPLSPGISPSITGCDARINFVPGALPAEGPALEALIRGEFLTFLEPNDVWLPSKLEDQWKVLAAHPEAAAVFGRTLVWVSWGAHQTALDYYCEMGVGTNQLVRPPTLALQALRRQFQTATPSSTMIRWASMRHEAGLALRDFAKGGAGIRLFLAKLQLHYPVYVADCCWVKERQRANPHGVITESAEDPEGHPQFLKEFRSYLRAYEQVDPKIGQVLEQELATHDLESVRQQIREKCPRFPVEKVRFLGEGIHNRVYRVNDAYIFRFPKLAKDRRDLTVESRLLKLVSTQVELDVPSFRFTGEVDAAAMPDSRRTRWKRCCERLLGQQDASAIPETVFAGYPEIQGSFLYPDFVAQSGEETRQRLAMQIAGFLAGIHSVPVPDALAAGARERRLDREYYRSRVVLFEQHGLEALSLKEAARLGQLLGTVEADRLWEYFPCLLHGDLNWDHILVDAGANRISGVIDFGSMFIGDPAYDFVPLWLKYGNHFCRSVLGHYGRLKSPLELRRVQFYRYCDLVQVLGWGKNRKPKPPEEIALQELRQFIASLE